MPGRWRAAAVAASGFGAGILTAIPAGILGFNLYLGAAWSNIHGGASDLTLAVIPLVVIALPFGAGFLASWGMNRWLSKPREPASRHEVCAPRR